MNTENQSIAQDAKSKETQEQKYPVRFKFFKPGEKECPFDWETDRERNVFWTEEYYLSTSPDRVAFYFGSIPMSEYPDFVKTSDAPLPTIATLMACMIHFEIMTVNSEESREGIDWSHYLTLSRDD